MMLRNQVTRAVGLATLMLLSHGLARGQGTTPFRPAPVDVTLGEEAGAVTLMTTQSGGFTLNGEEFTSGGLVAGRDGRAYSLTLVDGTWVAAYEATALVVPLGLSGETVILTRGPDGRYLLEDAPARSGTTTVTTSGGSLYTLSITTDDAGLITWVATFAGVTETVALGSSGSSVTLSRAENGSYSLDGQPVRSGVTTVMAANGSSYILRITTDDTGLIKWEATFVQQTATVALGTSGSSVTLSRTESGGYLLNGNPVASGVTTATASDGSVYTLSLTADGTWSATQASVTQTVSVALGTSGGTVTLAGDGAGGYLLNGNRVISGVTTTRAANGNQYRLVQGTDGMWQAQYVKATTVVPLDSTGSTVSIVTEEDGSYTLDGETFASGSTHTSTNGTVYRLTLAGGRWSAEQLGGIKIQGTELTAIPRDTGGGYIVEGQVLPATGVGDVTVEGGMYHVWMEADELKGVRFDAAVNPNTVAAAYALIGDLRAASSSLGTDMSPTLSRDDPDTAANELGTKLEIAGHSFSIGELLNWGVAADYGSTFVSVAVEEITKAKGQIDSLITLREALGNAVTNSQLDAEWTKIQGQIDSIFGTTGSTPVVDLGNRPADDKDLPGRVEGIREALLSGSAFVAATMQGGDGVFEDAAFREAAALQIFGAPMREASILFGATGPTRYGALLIKGRHASAGEAYYDRGANLGNGDPGEMGVLGAFSYGTIDDLLRTRHVQDAGTAYYRGGTTAVSGDGKLYAGDIELEVRFSNNRVSGLLTNLQSTAGDLWIYLFGAAESILLPVAASLDGEGNWTAAGQAEVSFERGPGSPQPQQIAGTFAGELLGRGDESGDYAHGTWSVGTHTQAGTAEYLAGSFGAQRSTRTAPPTRSGETHLTSGGAVDAMIADGNLVVAMNRVGRYLEGNASTMLSNPDSSMRTVLGAEPNPADVLGNYEPTILDPVDGLMTLDGDASRSGLQFVTVELKQSIADIVANPQVLRIVDGPQSQVELAVAEIQLQETQLSKLLDLDDPALAQAEQNAWKTVQETLLRVFHHVPPKLESYDRQRALRLLGDVLNAFSSSSSLAAALDRNAGGVFSDVTQSDGVSEPAAGLIWNRQEVQMETQGGATALTAWGAWRLKADPYAAKGEWTDFYHGSGNARNGPGAFTWSRLPATRWLDQNDPRFPGGGNAEFVGGTTASLYRQAGSGRYAFDSFFDGKVSVRAEWNSSWAGGRGSSNPLGALSMSVSELTNIQGDSIPRPSGLSSDDYSLVFSGAIPIYLEGPDNEVAFVGLPTASPFGSMNVDFVEEFSRAQASATPSGFQGRFVGQEDRGPMGVIGTYAVTYDGAGCGGCRLLGSFGAEWP